MKRVLGLLLFAPSLANASPRDIDGDGYDDAVLDHHLLIYGSAKGPAIEAKAQLAPRPGHEMIYAVEIVGDVDGDGFADAVFGDPDCGDVALDLPPCGIGSFALHRGGPNRLGPAIQTIKAATKDTMFGAQIVALGDVDGDKHADIAVVARDGVTIFHGSTKGFERPTKLSATDVVPIGDVDKDGKADVIGFEPQRATIYYSADGKRTALVPIAQDTTFVGMAAHGDFDGDGWQDLAITQHQVTKNTPVTEVKIYPGGPKGFTNTSAAFSRGPEADRFGTPSAVGDLDGDGRDDLVVVATCTQRAQGSCNGGTAYLYLGSAKGLVPVRASLSPVRTNWGITSGGVVPLGDSDGDKHADFAYGAYIYRGGKGGLVDPKPPSL